MSEFDSEVQDSSNQELAALKARGPSIIQNFGIRQLYGYRTISLSSEYAATVIIAKNGTGKTTLLAVMDAFLKRQYSRLRNLEFSEIFCQIRGHGELILTHDDLLSFLQVPSAGELGRLAGRVGLSVESIFDFLLTDYSVQMRNYYSDADNSPAAQKLMQAYDYDISQVIKACDDVYLRLLNRNSQLQYINDVLARALSDYEILYLPTYRRVELALTDDTPDRAGRRRKKPRISVAAGSLHVGDIQFGLSDISERLEELNRDIVIRSNIGYREISENIINELIRGYEVSDADSIPTLEELRLFFSRLESGSGTIGPYYGKISPPEYERIYSGDGVPSESRRFLSYFLGKLAGVIRVTEGIARPVEQFVSRCNKYLASSEPSTHRLDEDHRRVKLEPIDAKMLVLDKADLSVTVRSLPYRTPISLDALSSGEKHMISLFAKLYLYPKKKIVLIDEPELSLSIDWQRDILVDVLLSPQCDQVMAITHSPFVFDNALEPFARSIYSKIDPVAGLADQFGRQAWADEASDSNG